MKSASAQRDSARVRLGDVVVRAAERYEPNPGTRERWIGADHLAEGDLRTRNWGHTDAALFPPTFRYRFRAGHVLLHSRNPKKVAIAEFDGITGEKLFVLAPLSPEALDSRYLAYVLQSGLFADFVARWLSGSVN